MPIVSRTCRVHMQTPLPNEANAVVEPQRRELADNETCHAVIHNLHVHSRACARARTKYKNGGTNGSASSDFLIRNVNLNRPARLPCQGGATVRTLKRIRQRKERVNKTEGG